MNDSKSYVPSESENEEFKVPPQNKRLSKKSISSIRKESIKKGSERLSANESKNNQSDRISSYHHNSVYIDNMSNSYAENDYSCIPCIKPRVKDNLSKHLDINKIIKPKKRFDANKSVDYRASINNDVSDNKDNIKKSKSRVRASLKSGQMVNDSKACYCFSNLFSGY